MALSCRPIVCEILVENRQIFIIPPVFSERKGVTPSDFREYRPTRKIEMIVLPCGEETVTTC